MNRGDVLWWLVIDCITLEPVIRVSTRDEARALAGTSGLIASVRYER